MYKHLLALGLALLALTSCQTQEKEPETPYLIVLSLDGFRWDYPEQAHTPVLDSLAAVGVKAQSVKPSFPTKTFPNHYTMATGLYPDHHGIVLNRFYAIDLDRNYSLSDRATVTDGSFYGGKPIWNVAEEQGVTTATLFWVGASADVNGERPSFWSTYVSGLPLDSRIDSLTGWLSLPEDQRPHLIMWYYLEPDMTGHHEGTTSDSLVAQVEFLDAFLGDFFTAMRKLPVFDRLNFIVTSDHGMADLSEDKVVMLDEYVDTALFKRINGGNPVYNFQVKKEGKLDQAFNALKQIPHVRVWKHGELPQRLHYGTNPRTLDLTLLADNGWSAVWSWKKGYAKATHGYDNEFKDMHAIFYAAGPAFKTGYNQPTFDNVDLFPLMARILKLQSPPVDGSLEPVQGMLKK